MKRLHVNYKNNQRKILFLSIFIVFLFMGIGYSILTSELGILGKVKVVGYKEPVLALNTTTSKIFNKTLARSTVEKIEFKDSSEIPDNVIDSWDASANNDSSVIAYIQDEDNNELYELYIIGRGGVKANPNSSYAFYGFSKLTSINFGDYYNTSDVTSMYSMFRGCKTLKTIDLSSFDTSSVTNMSYMFGVDENHTTMALTTLDLSKFNTSSVTNMSHMFSGCYYLESLDVSSFNTSKVENMSYMFGSSNVNGYGIGLSSINLNHFDLNNVTNMTGIFARSKLTSFDFSNFGIGKITSMASMFRKCAYLTYINFGSIDTSNITNMQSLFSGCSSIETINISSLNTSKVTDMSNMFSGCTNLINIVFGDNFDTSSVTTMKAMFGVDQNHTTMALTTLDLSKFNTSSVTDMSYMFSGCYYLESLDLSNFNTSKVENMSYMFGSSNVNGYGLGITNLDLSTFDTGNVTNMTGMFAKSKIENLNLSSMDFTSITITNMFNGIRYNPMNIIVKDDTAKELILSVNSTANITVI